MLSRPAMEGHMVIWSVFPVYFVHRWKCRRLFVWAVDIEHCQHCGADSLPF